MDSNYDFALMLPFLRASISQINVAIMTTGICENEPYRDGEFDTMIFNINYIEEYLKKEDFFYDVSRHVIILNEPDTPDKLSLHKFIEPIIDQCILTGDVFVAYEDFAKIHFEESYWGSFQPLAEEASQKHLSSLTWSFEDGTQSFSSDPLAFDERIIITISWPTDNGTESFQGSWYVTSPSFLKKRLKTIDPYYRRHMLIMEKFDKDLLEVKLQERLLNKLYWIQLHVRTLFLKKNMEYPGQLMCYQR